MNRTLLVLFIALFGFALHCGAAEESKAPKVTSTIAYSPNYLAFGAGIELWDSGCIQGSVSVSFDNGFYIFLWGSTDMEGRYGNSLADEIDLGVGWVHDLGHGWTLDLGLTYFEEPHLGRGARIGPEDILYSKVKLSHSIGKGWTASAIWESYTVIDANYNGGTLLGVEVSKTFKLSERVTVPFCVCGVYDDGGFGFGQGWLIRGNLGADITLSDHITMNIGGRYYLPLMDDPRENDVMGYVGFTFTH